MFISASNKVPKNKFHNSFLCKFFYYSLERPVYYFICLLFYAPMINRLVISALTTSTENDRAQVAEFFFFEKLKKTHFKDNQDA